MGYQQSAYAIGNRSNVIMLSPQIEARDLIPANEVRVRYLSLGDSARFLCNHWVENVFSSVQHFRYAENDTHFLSSMQSDFDCLIVGGMDAGRMVDVLQGNMPLLRNRLLVALMVDSTPEDRAKVIRAGYDDAMDVDGTGHAEAAARVRAMWSRMKGRR
jgi:hypothetical protein